MRKQLFLVLLALPLFIFGQQKANYDLAARFSPKKLDKMIFSLSVDPHWLKPMKQVKENNGSLLTR